MPECPKCGGVYAFWEQWSSFQMLYYCGNGHTWIVLTDDED